MTKDWCSWQACGGIFHYQNMNVMTRKLDVVSTKRDHGDDCERMPVAIWLYQGDGGRTLVECLTVTVCL